MYKGGDCVGITISGGLISALALMVCSAIYWKKFGTKRQPLIEDYSMVFTLEEIMEATQNFSQKIGRTDFGSVFFGKLPDGKEIGVKVSSNIRRANEEFLNEVDLLSRVHHKNVGSVLGYCIGESGKLMLIYDYLSEGPLTEHLYGKHISEEYCSLDWVDAAKYVVV